MYAVNCSVIGPWPYNATSFPENPTVFNDQYPQTQSESGVCHLKTERRNIKRLWIRPKVSYGSAVVVDGKYLVTAAHNLADYPLLNRLISVEVTCNVVLAAEASPTVTLNRNEIISHRRVPEYAWRIYKRNNKFENDYAFLFLGKEINVPTELNMDSSITLKKGDNVQISGYPGGDICDSNTLYTGEGVVADIDSNLVTYTIHTAKGNSGGPVWVTKNDKKYLQAIHVRTSGGRALNSNFYKEWNKWKEEIENKFEQED